MTSYRRNTRIKKAIKPGQLKAKRKEKKERLQRVLKLLVFLLPIIAVAILYLLCIWGIFCVTDYFGFRSPQMVGKVTQRFILNGDVLSLTNANSVDLSGFHEYYSAGEGLKLTGFEFSLKESGVTPGTYGSSNMIPVLHIDKYGRVTHAETVPLSVFQTKYSINNMSGPDFTIQGTDKQVIVQSQQNVITLKTPQDIDIDSSPTFANLTLTEDLHLGNMIYDSFGNAGPNNSILVSDGTNVTWQDINAVTSDDQVLYWDPTTYDLSIEDGNTVNLSALNLWKQEPIGGWYTTDVLSPKDGNVQRIFMDHTGWGLTELQIRNNDNTNNYSGAVLSLKGSGPDYTNNMFFAKLGDNYYVPSWAGKGVVSTDQPLMIASVKSHDPDHPNTNPYIMFQTGGYYTAPVDRMILDSNGNLGIANFNPNEKLTINGNINLSGSSTARIYSQNHELLIGGNNQIVRAFSDSHVRLAVDSNNHLVGRVWVGANRDPTSLNSNKLFLVVSSSNNVGPTAFVRYSNNNAGPVALYYKARGTINSPSIVSDGDVLGGYNSLAYNGHGSTGWQLVAQLRHRVDFVDNDDNVIPYLEFKQRQPGGAYKDVARMLYDGRFGIGNTDPEYTLDLDPLNDKRAAINIRPSDKGFPGAIRFEDNNRTDAVELSAPNTIYNSYSLFLPPEQGNQYDVMYNDGTGNLLWDRVEHLLSIGVGAHAILYSDGNNVVGDAAHLYWDWSNYRMGINTTSPQVPLEIDVGNGIGLIVRKTTGNGSARIVVASNSLPSARATRVEISNDGVIGTWYNSTYWMISRDLWGSGSPGIKLGGNSGMWYKLGSAGGNGIPQYSLIFTTNNTHRAIITRGGNVGVGTMNPGALFQVGEAGDGTYAIANDWQTFSDERLKTNIKPVDQDVLTSITTLQPVTYIWKNGKDHSLQIGFIAQDLKKVFPLLVKKLDTGLYTVNYSKLSVYIVQAIKEIVVQLSTLSKQMQELKAQNQKLQRQVNVLNQQINELQQRVAALEKNNSTPTSTPKPKPTPSGTTTPTPTKIISPTTPAK